MPTQAQANSFSSVTKAPFFEKDDDRLGTKTLQLRIKDKHAATLLELSKQVNTVWNFCNELGLKILQREHRFCSAYDIHPYLAGASKEGMDLHSQTIQAVADEYVTRRKQFKKPKLRWRASFGSRRALGWIPFKKGAISYRNGQAHYAGIALSLWDSYGLADYALGSGSISQDARGRWYINICVKQFRWPVDENSVLPAANKADRSAVGLDLGLKSFLTTSEGKEVEAPQFYRSLEKKLAVAQRAGNKDRVRAIHAKIKNQRKDSSHKLSTSLVSKHGAIFVGNVSSSGLAKTKLAKSVLDAGWGSFVDQLRYKCDFAGVVFHEVNESYTTQTCHVCQSKTGPKGLKGLAMREWTCSVCNSNHKRDVNAAINIKQRGVLQALKEFEDQRKEAFVQSLKIPRVAEAGACETTLSKDSLRSTSQKCVAAGVGHDPLVAGILVVHGE